jgi:tetratricopeptide (TPR) repeat protein
LSDLATLPGEDRRGRLYEALAAYDDALRYRRPENAPLDYAGTQNNRANILSALATLPGEDRRGRLYEALAAYDDALRYRRPENAPLDYATTQNNRANILSALATLPGEDRRGRLYEALAAYDDALRYRRPENAPLDYATTQNNRATILSDLATLPGEDRRGRLYEALAAYDDALRYLRPENAPLAYAQTQNNRANILSDLATLPGEDRRGRLYAALAAYDGALRYRRPENAPLDYAQTQNNRANRLSALATLPGEDRRGRLYEALAAYDDALRYRRPENAPLDYATTQNNRANRLSDLATLPGEDRRGRLYEALYCAVEAVSLFEQFQQAQYLEIGRRVLRSLRAACGGDFPALWAELGLGEPPDWLMEESDGDAPAPALPADLQARLAAAGVADEASLQAALEADPTLRADFEAFFQQNPQLAAAMQMNALLQAFAAVNNTEEMIAFWRSVPTELEEPFVQAVEQLIDQARAAGEAETVKVLRSRLEGFQEMRAGAARTLARQEPLLAHLEHYQALLQAADAEQPQVEPWRSVTQAGEALLALQPGAEHLLNWDALRRQLASAYNILGNALDNTGDKAAALAAYERASELQPDFAMWRRNQTGMLIELGRLDAARAALAAARALEPDAPRLAELEADLAAAEGKEE